MAEAWIDELPDVRHRSTSSRSRDPARIAGFDQIIIRPAHDTCQVIV
jgi:hypothetical protein